MDAVSIKTKKLKNKYKSRTKAKCKRQPLFHADEKKYTFPVYRGNENVKLSSVLINGLHLNFVTSGSFGRVESLRDGRSVKKTLMHATPKELNGSIYGVKSLDSVSTSGCKEVLVMRRINHADTAGKFAPLLLGATFDTYSNCRYSLSLVRELVMSHTGRSICHWSKREEALPVKLLLEQGLEALKFLHKLGVYHCDVSSGNITYDRLTNRFRLIDFGYSSISNSPTEDYHQTLKLLDYKNRQQVPCVIYPKGFLSSSCQEEKAVVHILDSMPVDGYMLLGEEEITTFPFRDISVVVADDFDRRWITHRYDVYSLGMVVNDAMGFQFPAIKEFCYAQINDLSEENRIECKSNAKLLCQHNRQLRGGLTYDELELLKTYINDDSDIVDAFLDYEDEVCDLDWAAHIFGTDVTETVKSMIHPLPHLRNLNGYALHPMQYDSSIEYNVRISLPMFYDDSNDGLLSTIVVNSTWTVPFNDCVDDASERRHISFCKIGSIAFRRKLDLPNRVYIERIFVQPRYQETLGHLLRRSLQKAYKLFSPALSGDEPIDLIILCTNGMERDLIVSTFPRSAVEMDKNHMKIIGWKIYSEDESKSVGYCRV